MSDNAPVPDRCSALVAAMTLEEKIGQLTMVGATFVEGVPTLTEAAQAEVRAGRAGSILTLWGPHARESQRIAVEESRLKIPLLLTFDVLHGQRTIFPIPLAEAAAFDPLLWERTAREAAAEAAEDGVALTYAPMLDVCRDPRWGRIAECPGEDPWLAARFAEAKVRGFQGSTLSDASSVAATAKHFAAYGAVTAGRDYASVDISERTLHEVHLPPFRAAVGAGVAAIMPAFTDLAGQPMTANAPLLRDLLRKEWGFDGVIISDYEAVAELMVHGVAGDVAEAAALALAAGVDIDMVGNVYSRGLLIALERGTVEMAQIDAAVGRVLRLKEQLGLFDDPWRRGSGPASQEPDRQARRRLARAVARRSIVLLTNNGTLPLARDLRRIALVGPLAEAGGDMFGPWPGAGRAEDTVTFHDGLSDALPNCEIAVAAGSGVLEGDEERIAKAVGLCASADAVILCIGETPAMCGEACSRAAPDLPASQRRLAEAVLETGKPVIVLLSSGRPLMVTWLAERADALLATWFLGSEAGHAVADVLTGRWNPTGRLPVSWPVDTGQIPVHFAQRRSGRPCNPEVQYTSRYLDLPNEPLFPFGHGLSYTRFRVDGVRVNGTVFTGNDDIVIDVDVVNEGAAAGEETVLLFVQDPVARIARPILELKGVARLPLAPGERDSITMTLPATALGSLGTDFRPVLEPGDFDILVGTRADPRDLVATRIRIEDGR